MQNMQNDKMFQVQAPHRGDYLPAPRQIRWELVYKAYTRHVKLFSSRQSLLTLAERGGFVPAELDCLLNEPPCNPIYWDHHTAEYKLTMRNRWVKTNIFDGHTVNIEDELLDLLEAPRCIMDDYTKDVIRRARQVIIDGFET